MPKDKKTNLRTLRLLIAFDGTRYEGWQSQRNNRTIQEIFEKTLSNILGGQKIDVTGSSRTDSGVHAEGFVAHFKAQCALADEKIQDALNFYLPKDIVVLKAETAAPDFHARFKAKSKIYRYDIWNNRTRPVFEAPFTLWYSQPLNLTRMRKAATHLVGRHDFRAFKDSGDEKDNTVRTIKKLSVQKKGSIISLMIEGDGFLTHMVRVIAGTLIDVGRGKTSPTQIPAIIRSKDRHQAGPTAKALGLTLVKVIY